MHEIEELVNELETRVDRLRSLYEMYFMGIEKLEPAVARKEVDRRVQILRREQIRNTALRFRFQMLIQKYTTYQSYWTRTCRRIEEGTFKRQLGHRNQASVRPPPMSQPPAPVFELDEHATSEHFSDPNRFFSERPGGIDDDLDSAFNAIGAIPKAPTVPSFENKPPARPKSHPAMPSVVPPAYKPRRSSTEMEAVRSPERKSMLPPAEGRRSSSAPVDPAQARRERMIELAQRARRQQGSVFPPAREPDPPVRAPAAPPARIAPPPPPVARIQTPPLPARTLGTPPAVPPRAPAGNSPRPEGTTASPRTGGDLNDARVREIYNKYVETKRAHQESTAAITYDAVARTLRESTEKLKEKHKGKSVDFEVTVKDGKTVLKPIVK